ncbi:MAG TPA: WXG100 family type VII secretion target [Candidatus Limnocylindrales bacterium]
MPTDFSRFTPLQQAEMLAKGDPAAVRACGDLWSDVAGSLYSRVGDLEQQLRSFGPYWTGTAAEQYKQMVRNLIEGMRQTADVARLVAENVYRAGEALAAAKRYPRQALPELARIYAALEATIPPVPRVAGVPSATEVLTGQYRPDPALLFSGVYGNGLASASAALGGRFSDAVQRIVGPGGPPVPAPGNPLPGGGDPGSSSPAPETVTPLPPGSLGSVPSGFGGSGMSPVSFSDAGLIDQSTPPPTTPGVPVTPGGPAGAGAAGGFFPPMMPFGGAGAAGAGGDGFGSDRAVPVWLTEPEPDVVFGVPLQAVISVIGEEPVAAAPPSSQWSF